MALTKGEERRQRRGEQRREVILTAAAQVIAAKGYHGATTREIAEAADLAEGTIFNYFPTKRELLLHGLCPAALLRFCAEFHGEYDALTATDPRRYLEEGIRIVVQQAAPEVCEEELHKCGRGIRRAIFAALLDQSASPEELQDELRILVDGYVGGVPVA